MGHHQNNGNCPGCIQAMDTYVGFSSTLYTWFRAVQKVHPDFHIAEAGRGKVAQERDFHKGASKAHYGQSAHNCNAAFDTFFQIGGNYHVDEYLYKQIEPWITAEIEWYGEKGAKFYERPHYELKGWRVMLAQGLLHLVE